MAKGCLILGPSGSGKSTAIGGTPELNIKGLNPKETMIINVKGKPLPFRGWSKDYTTFTGKEGNYFASTDFPTIIAILKGVSDSRPDIKNIVLDDAQYLMAEYFMSKALIKGYDKFTELAKYTYDVLNTGLGLRNDLHFIVIAHSEDTKDNSYKMKTIGKMLDEKVTLEGLFTIVLYADQIVKDNGNTVEKRFVTNFDGQYPAKSPVGMFKEVYIPNDLGFVVKEIDKYYN